MEVGAIYEFISGLSHDGLSLALNGLLMGISLAAGAWLVWRYMRDHDAAISYAAWWIVLSAVIVAPLLLSVSPKQSSPTVRSAVTANAVAGDRGETTPWVAVAAPEEPRPTEIALHTESWHESSPLAAHIGGGLETSSRWRDASKLMIGLAPISLFGLWLCACLGLMARLWQALRHMTAIKRSASPLPIDLAVRTRRLVRESGLNRPVYVGVSSQVKFPMAAGLGDPTILIPTYLLAKLEPAEMDAIVLHELVHLRRWDDWTKLLQRMIEATLFFNPVVHWIGRKLDQAREMACDDRGVAQTGQPTDYARCLTKLAEMNVSGRGLLVPGALVNRKFIFRRLDRVLNTDRPTSGRRSGFHLAAIAATVVLAVTLLVQISPAVSLPLEPLSYDQLAGGVNSLLESFAQEDGAEPVEDKSTSLGLADIGSQESSLKMLALKDTRLAAESAAPAEGNGQRSSRQKPAAKEKNETWSFEANDRIRVNTVSGDCVIEKSTTGKIEVKVQWSYRPADSFEPRVRETASGIRVSEKMHGTNSGRSKWLVSVPDGVEVEFRTASGDLTVSGLTGNFSANTASGDITLMSCGGGFDMSTASGDIEATKCDGSFAFSTASGGVDIADSKGEFDVSSASGDIDGRGLEFTAEGRLSAASGDIELELIASPKKDLVLSSASGDVVLDYGGHDMNGKFEFIAKKRHGRIEAPFDFDEEETFLRWGERYVREVTVRNGETPLIRLETASGSVVLLEG